MKAEKGNRCIFIYVPIKAWIAESSYFLSV